MAKGGKVLETVITIAGEISPTLGKAIGEVEKRFDGVNTKALGVSAAIGGIAVGTGTAVLEAGKYLANLGDEYNSAVNNMAAETGLYGEELDGLSQIMKDVYANNFGESMEDVASGLSIAKQNTGLMGDELQAVTESAFALKDTFEYDLTESTRAAKAMMDNFGVSGDQAMSMIAAGAQNGLDYSGEMIDSISEYSVQFAKLGMDADDMFNIFQAGADSGAWNLDKVGDAIKEFSIRSIDGSKTSADAFKALGLNAEDAFATFAQGGDVANEAFREVLQRLMDMEDPVARDAAGVGLFGTMWEDLGVDAMQALADVQDGVYDTGDALEKIKEVKYDNIGDAFEGIKRQAEVALLPLASTIANAFTKVAPVIGNLFESLGPVIQQVTDQMMPFLTEFLDGAIDTIGELSPMISDMLSAILPLFGQLVIDLLPPLLDLAQALLPPILEVVRAVLPVLVSLLSSVLPIITQIALAILPVVAQLIAQLLPILQPLLDLVMIFLEEFINPLLPPIMQLVNSLMPLIMSLVSALVTSLSPFLGILVPIGRVLGEIVGWVTKLASGAADVISDIVGLFTGGGSSGSSKGLPAYAAGGFTSGLSLAGEAGQEAVISFNPLYRKQNIAYWTKAGLMLGAIRDENGFALTGNTSNMFVDFGGISFSPNVIVKGNADKNTIMQAIEAEYMEFIDLLEYWWEQRTVGTYG